MLSFNSSGVAGQIQPQFTVVAAVVVVVVVVFWLRVEAQELDFKLNYN